MQETFKLVLLLFVTFSVLTVFEVGSHLAQDGHESFILPSPSFY